MHLSTLSSAELQDFPELSGFNTTTCINTTILDDTIIDPMESFHISFLLVDDRDRRPFLGGVSAVVVIEDNGIYYY